MSNLRVRAVQVLIACAAAICANPAGAAELCGQLFNPPPKRDVKDIKTLKVMAYNVENFFSEETILRLREVAQRGNLPFKVPKLKSPDAIAQTGATILRENPDIVVLEEVESQMLLGKFSHEQLQDRYNVFLVRGNDGRGINIGFLVKADLPFEVEVQSHKKERMTDPVTGHDRPVFSRDLPVLLFRRPGAEKPFLIVAGNHAKSQRETEGRADSATIRKLQYDVAAKILKGYLEKYGADTPVMIAGDFNIDVRTSPEISPLQEFMKSAFDLGKAPVPAERRATEVFMENGQPPKYSQLDEIMVTSGLQNRIVGTRVVAYQDAEGNALPLPQSFRDRKQRPSDHQPVVTEFGVEGFF